MRRLAQNSVRCFTSSHLIVEEQALGFGYIKLQFLVGRHPIGRVEFHVESDIFSGLYRISAHEYIFTYSTRNAYILEVYNVAPHYRLRTRIMENCRRIERGSFICIVISGSIYMISTISRILVCIQSPSNWSLLMYLEIFFKNFATYVI